MYCAGVGDSPDDLKAVDILWMCSECVEGSERYMLSLKSNDRCVAAGSLVSGERVIAAWCFVWGAAPRASVVRRTLRAIVCSASAAERCGGVQLTSVLLASVTLRVARHRCVVDAVGDRCLVDAVGDRCLVDAAGVCSGTT